MVTGWGLATLDPRHPAASAHDVVPVEVGIQDYRPK